MATSPFPKEGQGFRAEVKIGDDMHLTLMVWYTAVGYVIGIYDIRVNKFVMREWVEDFDKGKARAENEVRMWYRYAGRKEPFPELNWKTTGSGEVGSVAQTG